MKKREINENRWGEILICMRISGDNKLGSEKFLMEAQFGLACFGFGYGFSLAKYDIDYAFGLVK